MDFYGFWPNQANHVLVKKKKGAIFLIALAIHESGGKYLHLKLKPPLPILNIF